MSKFSNEEIIEKLECLEKLLKEITNLNEYIETVCPQEYAQKVKNHINSIAELKGRPSVFDYFPTFPLDEKEVLEKQEKYKKKKKRVQYVGGATAVCIVICFVTYAEFFYSLSSFGIIATAFLFWQFSDIKKEYCKKKKEYEESVAKFTKEMDAFKNAMKVYEEEKATGIAMAYQYKNDYKKAYEEYEQILNEYGEQKIKSMDEFLEKMEEVKTYDFMPLEYAHLIRPIIVLLKSGRADDYKEALNIAIQEEREEQAEAARRAEDARRTRILEEQAAEERRRTAEIARHNREMEQQQQMQQKMMLDEQRKQTKAMEAQQRESSRAAMEASKNASMRCARCAKHDACGRARGVPNCGAFEPKRY